jgi:ribose transport system ATP-binding protein
LLGSGRTELVRVLIGEDHAEKGDLIVKGQKAQIRSVSEALYRYGIGYVSETERKRGSFCIFPVSSNIGMTIWSRIINKFTRKISPTAEGCIILSLIDKLNIKISSPRQEVQFLSGGNQQKVNIAKWLAADCEILIIDEPTIAVDIGAKEYIHDLIWDLAKNHNKSIILISSDLPEMLKLSRRIMVLQDQKIMGCLDDLNGKPEQNDKVGMKIGHLMV